MELRAVAKGAYVISVNKVICLDYLKNLLKGSELVSQTNGC